MVPADHAGDECTIEPDRAVSRDVGEVAGDDEGFVDGDRPGAGGEVQAQGGKAGVRVAAWGRL
jgi:hypothetical protein